MFALIGTIIGLLGSFFPELLKFLKAKEDHRHELEVLKVQADMAKSEHVYRLEEVNAQADIAESTALYRSAELKPVGVRWADATLAIYNGTVRPTIAYAFMTLFILVKVAQYKVVTAAGIGMWKTIWQLWSQEDMAAFMTIIAFYFGARTMKYAMDKWGTPVPINNGSNNRHSQPALIPVKPTGVSSGISTILPTSPVTGP